MHPRSSAEDQTIKAVMPFLILSAISAQVPAQAASGLALSGLDLGNYF